MSSFGVDTLGGLTEKLKQLIGSETKINNLEEGLNLMKKNRNSTL